MQDMTQKNDEEENWLRKTWGKNNFQEESVLGWECSDG